MAKWKILAVKPNDTMLRAMKIIDENSSRFVMVLSDDKKILGTVTDGDIRRAILKGTSPSESILLAMNPKPIVANSKMTKEEIFHLMDKKGIAQIPVLNDAGIVVDLFIRNELVGSGEKENTVVIMAGGLGTRLGDLTADCPKSLLEVKGKPVLEHIIKSCMNHGFSRFQIAVNYLGEQIEKYFKDGSQMGVEISYLRENKKLGTAGALSLLEGNFSEPILIMNGDLLTSVDFTSFLEFHQEHKSEATMCVREYDLQIPYGVVEADGLKIIDIVEKPVKKHFINAGIYFLDPKVLSYIPKDCSFDMPELFKKLVREKVRANIFPIHEYWLDIGQKHDLELARKNY